MTTITVMNINDFVIFIFSMITTFNKKIVLYIYKILFYNSCMLHLNYVEVEIRQGISKYKIKRNGKYNENFMTSSACK